MVREVRSGAFSIDGDSIGIPLFGWALITVVLAPLLNTAWWWLWKNYPGSVFLFVTDQGIDTRSHMVSIGLIAFAGALVVGTVWKALPGTRHRGGSLVLVLSGSYVCERSSCVVEHRGTFLLPTRFAAAAEIWALAND